MKKYSIFNDVLGPIMHGPSSSHTAASHRIGLMARSILGAPPKRVTITFDRHGSYGQVFRDQGSDLAFVGGLMGWEMTDDRFFQALDEAQRHGLDLSFIAGDIAHDDHPNAVFIQLRSAEGHEVTVSARSIGGGSIEINRIDDWPVTITGQTHELLILADASAERDLLDLTQAVPTLLNPSDLMKREGRIMVRAGRGTPWTLDLLKSIKDLPGVSRVRDIPPVFFVPQGPAVIADSQTLVAMAEDRDWSLGRLALFYETQLLGLTEAEVLAEMGRRLSVMEQAVHCGLDEPEQLRPMRLLNPTAHRIFEAEAEGRLALGGFLTRAATRAIAVMHVNAGMGLVCAAPTGGSSGVLPGVMVTMLQDLGVGRDRVVMALLAAAAIGLVVLMRGDTYAAEVAGCQVEIGSAGAMAAAAVVEMAGGSARQATDAAAIALQNTMGSPCDLVQGAVEIPCHTRNAVAASSAFICADLILGGYENPIPLDDSVDASLAVGRCLPPELRCTAKGGLSITPSALQLKKMPTR
ncbi:MAG: L-serine ammonia-lyase, iron-sulfur-dependent, subunit alpha [Deltaproteobacteria bacterium]|nr:L-serine ammonia-lyase, iron-sulfur-dependent, subunit alpha [Deltaproteobacteria bacterium]